MSASPIEKIRVGFLVGKDNDWVEDPKYVGDASFLSDLPDQYRVDDESKEYLKDCEDGTKGRAHTDVALPWYLKKHNDDIEVDIIFPEDISEKRLKSNMCNYIVGYDVINAVFESEERIEIVRKAFTDCGNCAPDMAFQNNIYYKSRYMNACKEAGIPMAPTIFAIEGQRNPAELLTQIKARGWTMFVIKQSFSAFCLGFMKCTVAECETNPKILEEYFEEHESIPEFVVQEAVEGFVRNWETRCFWFNGEFVYAIANKAAVSTDDGEEHIITGDDIPLEFLENAKRIGRDALKVLPQMLTSNGKPCGLPLVRTDIGCSDTQLLDCDNHWDPKVKTFFLNEIEYGGANWFTRHLKFDNMPIWGELFAKQIREIHAIVTAGDCSVVEPECKRLRTVLPFPSSGQVRPAWSF